MHAQQGFEILSVNLTHQRRLERLGRSCARYAEYRTCFAENLARPNYLMEYFLTVLAQGRDLHPAFLQEVNAVGGIAECEDPVATAAFGCSHHCIEPVPVLLTH